MCQDLIKNIKEIMDTGGDVFSDDFKSKANTLVDEVVHNQLLNSDEKKNILKALQAFLGDLQGQGLKIEINNLLDYFKDYTDATIPCISLKKFELLQEIDNILNKQSFKQQVINKISLYWKKQPPIKTEAENLIIKVSESQILDTQEQVYILDSLSKFLQSPKFLEFKGDTLIVRLDTFIKSDNNLFVSTHHALAKYNYQEQIEAKIKAQILKDQQEYSSYLPGSNILFDRDNTSNLSADQVKSEQTELPIQVKADEQTKKESPVKPIVINKQAVARRNRANSVKKKPISIIEFDESGEGYNKSEQENAKILEAMRQQHEKERALKLEKIANKQEEKIHKQEELRKEQEAKERAELEAKRQQEEQEKARKLREQEELRKEQEAKERAELEAKRQQEEQERARKLQEQEACKQEELRKQQEEQEAYAKVDLEKAQQEENEKNLNTINEWLTFDKKISKIYSNLEVTEKSTVTHYVNELLKVNNQTITMIGITDEMRAVVQQVAILSRLQSKCIQAQAHLVAKINKHSSNEINSAAKPKVLTDMQKVVEDDSDKNAQAIAKKYLIFQKGLEELSNDRVKPIERIRNFNDHLLDSKNQEILKVARDPALLRIVRTMAFIAAGILSAGAGFLITYLVTGSPIGAKTKSARTADACTKNANKILKNQPVIAISRP